MARPTWLLGLALLACPLSAHAEPPRGHAATAKAAAELGAAEDASVHAAIDVLAKAADAGAVASLAGFLREGQPDALADYAITALGETARPEALEPLAELTLHRRDAARRTAYAAIGRIEAPGATRLLAGGLGDPDPLVRAVCATALGRRRATEALDVLFRALARGVPEAAAAIGEIGDASSVARFHAELGRQPLATMLSGYESFLRRVDLDERVKLEIVGRLGEVASLQVKTFLQSLLATMDWRKTPRLRQSVIDTAARIDSPAPTVPSGGVR